MVADEPRHRVEPADLDMLEMLTSVPNPHDIKSTPPPHRVLDTVAALRRPPIDPIVLAASLNSGPQITRHHFHHTFVDPHSERSSGHSQQMPVSERKRHLYAQQLRQPLSKHLDNELERHAIMHSKQAPRSARLLREKEEALHALKRSTTATTSPLSRRDPLLKPSQLSPSLPPLEVRCYGRTRVPTPHGEVFCHLYRNNHDNKEHMALVIDPAQNNASIQQRQQQGLLSKPRHLRSQTLDAVWHKDETTMERLVRGAYVNRLSETYQEPSVPVLTHCTDASDKLTPSPLVRIHSECYTGETIGSQRCDCGEQLDEALRIIGTSSSRTATGVPVPPRGVVVYMRQEGRGIGLLDKLLAYNLQDMGHDTVSANVLLGHLPDARRYDISSAILRDLGIDQCRLLTNNPEKMQALEAEGIRVTERVPMVPRIWQFCSRPRSSTKPGVRRRREKPPPRVSEPSQEQVHRSRPSSVISQTLETAGELAASLSEAESHDDVDDEDDMASDESASSFNAYTLRNTGATLIGGTVTRGSDLERYLRTKIERMGHLLSEPGSSPGSRTALRAESGAGTTSECVSAPDSSSFPPPMPPSDAS